MQIKLFKDYKASEDLSSGALDIPDKKKHFKIRFNKRKERKVKFAYDAIWQSAWHNYAYMINCRRTIHVFKKSVCLSREKFRNNGLKS